MSDPELVRVRLVGVPLELRQRFSDHGDGLLRELALITIGATRPDQHADVPARLLALADELAQVFLPMTADPTRALQAAIDRGEHSVDLDLVLPVAIVDFLRRLDVALDAADELCRESHLLLTVPADDELVAYRRWVVTEFERQADGAAPTPWRPVGGTGRDGTA